MSNYYKPLNQIKATRMRYMKIINIPIKKITHLGGFFSSIPLRYINIYNRYWRIRIYNRWWRYVGLLWIPLHPSFDIYTLDGYILWWRYIHTHTIPRTHANSNTAVYGEYVVSIPHHILHNQKNNWKFRYYWIVIPNVFINHNIGCMLCVLIVFIITDIPKHMMNGVLMCFITFILNYTLYRYHQLKPNSCPNR